MSEISNFSSARAARASDTFPLPQLNAVAIRPNTFDTGVAVMTRIPKKRNIKRIGIARIIVTKATSGVEIPYPIQPPPFRIAV